MIRAEKNETIRNKAKSYMRIVYIVLSFTVFTGCSTKSANSINNNQMKENEVIKEFFRISSYEPPNYSDFKNLCINHIGIDVDTIKDSSFVIFDDYLFDKENRYIKPFMESVFYQPNREKATQTIEETALYLTKDIIGEQILAFNRLFFHNDILALPYFRSKDNYSDAVLVALWFDCEENETFLKNVIRDYVFVEPMDTQEIIHLLFYNNRSRGFKKKVIDYFFEECVGMNNIDFVSSSFQKLQLVLQNNYQQIDIDETVKDSCYIYIVEKMIEYDLKTENEKSKLEQYFGYTAIENLCYRYGLDFMDRLRVNNYFGNKIIQEYSRTYMRVKDIETPYMELNKDNFVLNARVEDKDGFVNIRKEPSISSDVIGTVRDKDIVTVLSRKNSDMWHIRRSDGFEGYIHKSRLNAYYQGN